MSADNVAAAAGIVVAIVTGNISARYVIGRLKAWRARREAEQAVADQERRVAQATRNFLLHHARQFRAEAAEAVQEADKLREHASELNDYAFALEQRAEAIS